MSAQQPPGARPARDVVATAAEHVFEVVEEVRKATVRLYERVTESDRRPCGADISTLRPQIQERLGAEAKLIVGLGLIVAPDLLADESLRLEWWQSEQRQPAPVSLAVDLKRSSPGFYDYATTEWFETPHRTGRRHIVGPYVDVHGTGRYILTFTVPVMSGDVFVGVVGADVSAPALERRLIAEFDSDAAILVINPENRVVVSNSPLLVQGDRVAKPGGMPAGTVGVPRLPWRVWSGDIKQLTSEVSAH